MKRRKVKSLAAKQAMTWETAVAESVSLDITQKEFWDIHAGPLLLAEFTDYETMVARKEEVRAIVRGVVISSMGKQGVLAETKVPRKNGRKLAFQKASAGSKEHILEINAARRVVSQKTSARLVTLLKRFEECCDGPAEVAVDDEDDFQDCVEDDEEEEEEVCFHHPRRFVLFVPAPLTIIHAVFLSWEP
jgi:hypothetical protein